MTSESPTLIVKIQGAYYRLTRQVDGWRLQKPDGTIYDVRTAEDASSCSCPSFVHRGRSGACKHVQALIEVELIKVPAQVT